MFARSNRSQPCQAPVKTHSARCATRRFAEDVSAAQSEQQINLHVLLVWSLVGLPLAWGFLQTLRYALLLFR
jgi:hypothetical protein